MMFSNKNVLLYGAIAIIAAVAVFSAIVITFQPSGPYNVKVSITPMNYAPNATYIFNNTKFNITIKNTGSSYIKGMQVGFYLNNQALKYYNVSIPAHSNASISENYTYTANGTYDFSAVANPSSLLPVSNSSVTSASADINVSNPEQPNIYAYIPSNGTNSTYTFTLFPRGMEFSSLMAVSYNVSDFKPFMGPDPGLMLTIMHDLSPALNVGNGAYSKYKNGTLAYGMWLEGTAGNSYIRSILSTYSLPEHNFLKGSSTATFAKVNDTVSFCSYSSKGWTKLFFYYNSTSNATCQTMLASTYNDTEYPLVSNITSSHSEYFSKVDNFTYSNSTENGFAVGLTGGNYSVYLLSENNATGSFGSIMGFHSPLNISSIGKVCPGFIYTNNSTGLNMCIEYYRSPVTELQNFSLSNSMAISRNYSLNLFSFVSANDSNLALYNAANLMEKLNLTNEYLKWEPLSNSTCNFSNASLGCSYKSFDPSTGNFTIGIRNNYNKTIALKEIGCSAYEPFNDTKTLNVSLSPGSSINESLTCKQPTIPISSTISEFFANVKYLESGVNMSMNGTISYADFYVN